jgi:hypothetical protein
MGYKILQRTHHQLFTMNFEWQDKIDYVLEPDDDKYMKYFRQAWDQSLYKAIMPQRSMKDEFLTASGAMVDIMRSVFKSKVLKRK